MKQRVLYRLITEVGWLRYWVRWHVRHFLQQVALYL